MDSSKIPPKPGHLHHHQQPQLRCPRCGSSNTKFCYYNNYSLSQPRHYCRACKRYWTRGGSLRNIPVGGGCRKNKRLKRSLAPASVRPGVPPPSRKASTRLSPPSPRNNLREMNFPFSRSSPIRVSTELGFPCGDRFLRIGFDRVRDSAINASTDSILASDGDIIDPICLGSSSFLNNSTMASFLASSSTFRQEGVNVQNVNNPYEFPSGDEEQGNIQNQIGHLNSDAELWFGYPSDFMGSSVSLF